MKKDISILLPVYNEQDNLKELINKIIFEFDKSIYKQNYEIILINDYSTDNSWEELIKTCSQLQNQVILVDLKKNYGKAIALEIGFHFSSGKIICIMDSDLQYSPSDLVILLNIFNKNNLEVINGLRKKRSDNFLIKLSSNIFNFLLKKITKVKLNDFFSGIKIFDRKIYHLMQFTGIIRFLVFFSTKYNFRYGEYEISHNRRKFGKSSYSMLKRFVLAIKDIFSLFFCVRLELDGVYLFRQIINVLLVIIILIYFALPSLNYYFNYLILLIFTMFIFDKILVNFIENKKKQKFEFMNLVRNVIKININDNIDK